MGAAPACNRCSRYMCVYTCMCVYTNVRTYIHTWGCLKHDELAFMCVCKSLIYSCIFTCSDTFSYLINTHFYLNGAEVAAHDKLPFLVSADN